MRTTLAACFFAVAIVGAARADVVHLKDGRTIEGSVTREGDTLIVRHKLGSAHVLAADVERIEETSDRWDELERLRRQLQNGTADERYRFAVWAREHGFPADAKRAFLSVLRLDVDHPGARAALGYVQHDGRWITRDDEKRLRGLVEDKGEWVKPEEKAKREAERKAKAQAAREARLKAKEEAKLARVKELEREREERREAARERELQLARDRAWERAAASIPSGSTTGGSGWYGYSTRSALFYPYGRGGTCNGYRAYVQPRYPAGTPYPYSGNGVYYRRSGVGLNGQYNGGNWNLRWRIGY
ncbi:MAG: hypothetical protein AB7N76_01370 [Planctomycetota bacterium]